MTNDFEKINCMAVTTDCWTSKQKYSYIGATVHFIGILLIIKFILKNENNNY